MPLGANLDNEIAAQKPLIDVAHERNIPVIFSTVIYNDHDLKDAGLWAIKMKGTLTLKAGTEAVKIDPRLDMRPTDSLLVKKYASCFFGTDLVPRLMNQRVDTLIITGCTTSGCVRATAVDAVQSGFRPMVVREAVGDRSAAAHEQSLFDLNAKYADVVALDETLQYMKTVGHNRRRAVIQSPDRHEPRRQPMTITGGCHCGAIRYQVEGDADRPRAVSLHRLPASFRCADGRLDDVPGRTRSKLRRARPRFTHPRNSGRRQFCPDCGTGLFYINEQMLPGSHRYPERDLRRSRHRSAAGANPGRRSHRLDEECARAAGVRALPRRNACSDARQPIAAEIFSATMMVGMLVLARGTVGMIEASTTRSPSKPRTRPAVSTTASGSFAAPIRQVPATWNMPATFWRMCSASASSSCDQRREIDLAVGERGEHRPGQRRHEVGQPGDGLRLDRIRRRSCTLSWRSRSVNFTGKVTPVICRAPSR